MSWNSYARVINLALVKISFKYSYIRSFRRIFFHLHSAQPQANHSRLTADKQISDRAFHTEPQMTSETKIFISFPLPIE